MSGCNGCLRSFYQVHKEVEYLDIVYNEPKIEPRSVIEYLDSIVITDTTKYGITRSYNGVAVDQQQRIIHFKNLPDEYYRVAINSHPCWIMSILNKNIDSTDWIYSKTKIKQTELERIKNRFWREILSKVPKSL